MEQESSGRGNVIEFPAWRTRQPARVRPAIDHWSADPSLLDRALDAVEAVLDALARRRGRRPVAPPRGVVDLSSRRRVGSGKEGIG